MYDPNVSEEVLALYRRASEGDLDAAFAYALCCWDGDGIEKNEEEAFEWLIATAERGHTEAQFTVADFDLFALHFPDLSHEEAQKKRLFFYRAAAEGGHAEAAYRLGRIYEREKSGDALTYYRLAAELGSAEGAEALAKWEVALDDVCDAPSSDSHKEEEKALLERLDGALHSALTQKTKELYREGERRYLEAKTEEEELLAAETLRTAAEMGDPEAQLALAVCYQNAVGVPFDKACAASWLARAAEGGCAEAHALLGLFYTYGNGVPEDEAMAVAHFTQGMQGGSVRAAHELAYCYETGRGVTRDRHYAEELRQKAGDDDSHDVVGRVLTLGLVGREKDLFLRALACDAEAEYELFRSLMNTPLSRREILRWLRRAAQHGHTEGARLYADLMLSGDEGFARDEAEAVRVYELLADAGDASAAYRLAKCYETGCGTQRDAARARHYYELAAKENPDALLALGELSERGEGCPQSYKDAVAYYKAAALANCNEAFYRLGGFFEAGRGVAKDVERAVSLYYDAAKEGHAAAYARLSYCCAHGLGVQKNATWAKILCRNAIELGVEGLTATYARLVEEALPEETAALIPKARANDPVAQYELSRYYATCARMPKEAAHWLQAAAKQGYVDAVYDLGVCYIKGDLVEKDLAQAAACLRRAARSGHPQAQRTLAKLYRSQEARWEGRSLLEAISANADEAAMGSREAEHFIALCYERGEGVAKSRKHAIDAHLRAAELGLDESVWALAFLYCVEGNDALSKEWQREGAQALEDVSRERRALIGKVFGAPTARKRLLSDESTLEALIAVLPGAAKDWLRRIGDAGYPAAYHLLGHYSGDDAETWYLAAVKGDYVPAMCTLGELCASRGQTDDAVAWYRQAAERDFIPAQHALALLLLGAPQKEAHAEGASWLYRTTLVAKDPHACANGFTTREEYAADAAYRLGVCYERGDGVEASDYLAFLLFSEAAKEAHPEAFLALGRCYARGIGTEKNGQKAFDAFHKADELGAAGASYELGVCYETGCGTAQSYTDAGFYYQLAAHEWDPRGAAAWERLDAQGLLD